MHMAAEWETAQLKQPTCMNASQVNDFSSRLFDPEMKDLAPNP